MPLSTSTRRRAEVLPLLLKRARRERLLWRIRPLVEDVWIGAHGEIGLGIGPKALAKSNPLEPLLKSFEGENCERGLGPACPGVGLAEKRKILVDYADMRSPDDDDDPRCDLPNELRRDLVKAGRNAYDAVCVTHLDDDHCKGFGEFFWLRPPKAYQGDDRIGIAELWVPAAAILEELGLRGSADKARR